ncbi:MAG: HEAT repeat domain-containing protein [Desulfobulbaceae bacterium]|jgi:hypothetical protein|nr:HEAT repeat domain-containing protein [Desulfobulbaceae bacterium]MDY0350355.1 HEAT repeat domain-containing protein [Desulfobulbaceae bacterium]
MQETNNTLADTVSREELQAVKKTLLSFISAFKTYTLYPADHAFSRRNLSKLLDDLDAFLQNYRSLRLDTARNTFSYKGEIIYEGQEEESNPAYLLTRDGIEYIEFIQGITAPEISGLLNILNQHRNPFDDSGGDIVTSLWQSNFPHIQYEEVDIFTLESFQFDLSGFQVTPDAAAASSRRAASAAAPQSGTSGRPTSQMEKRVHAASASERDARMAEQGADQAEKPEQISGADLFLSKQGMKLLDISPEEENTLKEYVQDEEGKNFTSDAIDVLLIILVTQKDRESFLHILEFLEFEFLETMDRGEFHLSYKLLNNILIIRKLFQERKPWAVPLLDGFIASISEADKLNRTWWVTNEEYLWQNTPYLPHLWRVLRLLNPEVIFTLGPLAGRIPINNVHIRNELLEVIESKAKENPEKLGILLDNSGEQVNILLAPVIKELPLQKAAEIYLRMTRHSSAEVRRIGLDGYMQTTKAPDYNDLFHLLGDGSAAVRERITSYLLNGGEKTAVRTLIRFLSQATTGGEQFDQKIIFENYRALASCRSNDALPFLESSLLDSRLSDMFSNTNAVHKKGAAMALKTIGTDEALAVLQKGAQSLRPDIRLACQHALGR